MRAANRAGTCGHAGGSATGKKWEEGGNRADHAARVFGAAEVARNHYGTKFSANEQSLHESSLATLKNLLPEKDFLIAWEEGRRTPPWNLIKQSPQCAG